MNREMRKGKTRQDRMALNDRDRVQEANAIRSWSMKHKPRRSGDWLKRRTKSGL